MSAFEAVLWRHGQTDYNRAARLQGQVDVPINDVGLSQAAAAATHLATLKPVAIYSSDLSRASATAHSLARLCDVPVVEDKRLRERGFGEWEGLTGEEIRQDWPNEYKVWRGGGQPKGVGAQTRGEAGARVAELVREISSQIHSGTVVFTSHGAAISAGIATLLGCDPDGWRGISGLNNCHWSTLAPLRSGEDQWRLTAHNVGAL